MATLPPPYSSQDAARAQHDAAQVQRYYLRSVRRPSMLGPIVLIAFGVIALLVETGKLNASHLWIWYLRWWPLLLIGMGLLSLGEWWLDRGHPSVGRRSHGGLIALIICLALIGYTTRGLHGMHFFEHGGGDDDLFSRFLGQQHDADRNLNRQIPAGAMVDIRVPHGDVTVTPSGDDQIHVQAHQVVYAANDSDARRDLDALAPRLLVNGKTVTLRAAEVSNGRSDLAIEIPNGTVPTITSGHGNVLIEGLPGGANITAERGDVKVENVAAAVQVRMSKGQFSGHAISGDLSLQGRLEDVSISGVRGAVLLDGEFFGDTTLAKIAAPVHFHSSRTDIEVAGVPGNLSIDTGDLQLNNAVGPARISTSAKDIECSGITGDLRVEDGDGDISVGAVSPVGVLQIHNRNGAIHLTVPPDTGFQLQASARNGNVRSKLSLPVSGAGEGQSVSGQVGVGGPRIELIADHGDIEISRMDGPPVSPLPPAAGAKSLRHFRPSKDANGNISEQPIVQ